MQNNLVVGVWGADQKKVEGGNTDKGERNKTHLSCKINFKKVYLKGEEGENIEMQKAFFIINKLQKNHEC